MERFVLDLVSVGADFVFVDCDHCVALSPFLWFDWLDSSNVCALDNVLSIIGLVATAGDPGGPESDLG